MGPLYSLPWQPGTWARPGLTVFPPGHRIGVAGCVFCAVHPVERRARLPDTRQWPRVGLPRKRAEADHCILRLAMPLGGPAQASPGIDLIHVSRGVEGGGANIELLRFPKWTVRDADVSQVELRRPRMNVCGLPLASTNVRGLRYCLRQVSY